MTLDDVFRLIDGLRDRGVPAIKVKQGDFELEVPMIPPLRANELPTSPDVREQLLNDPNVSETLKDRISEEEDRDLYAAS